VGLQELTAAHTDIGPQPHPSFIDVFCGAPAVSPRAGVPEAIGKGIAGRLGRR